MDAAQPGTARSQDALLDTIDTIYATAIDTGATDAIPPKIASLLGADHITLWCIDTELRPVAVANYGLAPSAVDEYLEHWHADDALVATALRTHVGQTGTVETVLGSERAFRELPVFEGFYEKQGLAHNMGRFDRVIDGHLVGLAMWRQAGGALPGQDEQAVIETICKHLCRAWAIRLRMDTLDARTRGAESLLRQCNLASWLLDHRGRIQAANEAAEGIMARDDSGLQVTQGRLQFVDPQLDAALQASLQDAPSHPTRTGELPFGTRPRGPFAWGAVIPVQRSQLRPDRRERLSLLTLALRGAGQLDPGRLERRLPISRAEADVLARLMHGQEPSAIAAARGSTLETIRSYEKSLRSKLRCNSRAQLVARGWRAIATIADALNRSQACES